MSLSTSTSGANIPTFIVDMPPSPRKLRPSRPDSARVMMDAKSTAAKVVNIQKPSTPAPIPSIILQETAEEDRRTAVISSQSQTCTIATSSTAMPSTLNQQLLLAAVSRAAESRSHSLTLTSLSSVADSSRGRDGSGALVTMATQAAVSEVSSATTGAASLGKQPIYVQVMLQLPGSPLIPVNIPAEVILPTLTSIVSGSNVATMTTSTSAAAATASIAGSNIASMVARQISMDNSLLVDTKQNYNVLPPAPVRPPLSNDVQLRASTAVVRRSDTAPPTATVAVASLTGPTQPAAKIQRLSEPPVVMATLASVATARPSAAVSSVAVIRQHSAPSDYYRSTEAMASSIKSDSSDLDEDSKKLNKQNSRTAATRCRQKKKQQVENMENKAKDLISQNKQLEEEMSQLKHDICELENLLKDHEDCFTSASHSNLYYTETL